MRQTLFRQVKLLLLVFLGYFAHVSFAPYLSVGGVSPSLLIITTAIVIVGYGMLRGLWTGMLYGILMETMLPTVPMLNLLFYPISALFCSVFFADRSAAQLQYARSTGHRGRNRNPLVRTVLCALVHVTVYELVNLAYMYLSGAELSGALLRRGIIDIFLTTALTALVMYPVRKILGFRKVEEEPAPELRFDRRPARN